MPADAVVHLIDDDLAVRESAAFLLMSARIPVTTYESATAFLEVLSAARAGCVVTDVRMPDLSGIDLLRRLKELKIDMPVVVITGHGDVALAVEAMKAGAFDFIEKPFDDEQFLLAIRSALARRDRDDQGRAQAAELADKLANLTNREREVLEGLVAGHPNKTIAYDLGISPRTVEIYRANVMTKMNAGSLSELVRLALMAGVAGAVAKK